MNKIHRRTVSLTSKIYYGTAAVQAWKPPVGLNTGIQVANCVAKSTVPLILQNEKFATWYTCGPTVYAPSHLGHASCYVKIDIIQRILREYFNINILTAMNITDIDDKIIRQCSNNIQWQDVAKQNERTFWEDLDALNIVRPNIALRVSEHIPRIIQFITQLINKGAAYIGKDGSVYFKVSQCDTYGKLQKLNIDAMAVHDVKCSAVDFVLWKSTRPGEPFWESPWGKGRPGWHIECSTMAGKIFGHCIDFHAGGLDLRFPHHENEEAQSCMFYGKEQWVNYWLHTGQLFVKGHHEKMSKSLNNSISIRKFLDQHNPEDFRMACVLSNYNNAMHYSEELISNASEIRRKFITFFSDSQAYIDGRKAHSDFESLDIWNFLSNTINLVDTALRSNFDTSKAIGHVVQLISKVEKSIHMSPVSADFQCSSNVDSVIACKNFIERLYSIFGFRDGTWKIREVTTAYTSRECTIFDNLSSLRHALRKDAKATNNPKLFEIADNIRSAIESGGVKIKDHENGSSWQINQK